MRGSTVCIFICFNLHFNNVNAFIMQIKTAVKRCNIMGGCAQPFYFSLGFEVPRNILFAQFTAYRRRS